MKAIKDIKQRLKKPKKDMKGIARVKKIASWWYCGTLNKVNEGCMIWVQAYEKEYPIKPSKRTISGLVVISLLNILRIYSPTIER